jgi:hypothetical protein
MIAHAYKRSTKRTDAETGIQDEEIAVTADQTRGAPPPN